jgi:hypothetical protein
MAEQDLHCAQVARLLLDDGSLGSPQRMRPVILPAQPNASLPLVNEASILPGADVIGMINTARKDEVVERAASAFEPSEDAAAGQAQGARIARADLSSAEQRSSVSAPDCR